MTKDIAFEMAVSSVRYGVGVTREIGMDLAEMGARLVMVVTDPSTGKRAGTLSRSVQFFGRRIGAFTALGQVAPDRTPARVKIKLPRRISVRALLGPSVAAATS